MLFIIYAVFEISGVVFKKDYLSKAAYILLIFGVLSALAAVLSGNQAGEIAKSLRILPSEILEAHEEFSTISLLYFFAILVFRTYFVIKKKFVGTIKIVFVVLSIAGCFFIFITGLICPINNNYIF